MLNPYRRPAPSKKASHKRPTAKAASPDAIFVFYAGGEAITPGAAQTISRIGAGLVADHIDPVKTVVSQANAADVDTVFVAGEPVKRDGELLNVDLPPILDRLAASRDYMLEALRQYDNKVVIDIAAASMPLG